MPRHPYPPIPDTLPEFPANSPLDSALADLCGWWLNLHCRCGHSTGIPLRLMAAERGWNIRLSDVLTRLKCSKCGEYPSNVDLVDTVQFGGDGVHGAEQRGVTLHPVPEPGEPVAWVRGYGVETPAAPKRLEMK